VKSRICGIGKHIVARLSPETGQSLILALIIVLALTVSTAGLVTFLTSNEHSFSRDRSSTRALAVSEAGIQNAISVLSQYDKTLDLPTGTRLPAAAGSSTTYTVDGGTGSWWAIKTQQDDATHQYDIWNISSTGKSADGTVTRTVTEDARASPTITPALPIYNYALYVGGSGGIPTWNNCNNTDTVNNSFIGGSFTATGNLWIGNNVCFSGGAKITLPADNTYTLYTSGGLQTGGSSGIADSVKRLKTATIVGGCYTSGSKSVACDNTSKSNVFAVPGGYNFGNPGAVQTSGKPPVDFNVWSDSNWKAPTCTGAPPTFEAAGDNAASPVPVNNVTIDSNTYNCTFLDTAGNFLGSLAYNTGTSQLTINGEVFVNGNLQLVSNPGFHYIGNGTLYVNGTVTSKNDVCGFPATETSTSCSTSAGTWDQTKADMEIVAMNVGNCPSTQTTPCTAIGWTVNGSGEYDAIAFVRGATTATGNGSTTDFKGPVLTDFVTKINGGGGLYYPTLPPTDSPGGVQHGSTWQVAPGTWRQLTN
jgi:hypothetical protein